MLGPFLSPAHTGEPLFFSFFLWAASSSSPLLLLRLLPSSGDYGRDAYRIFVKGERIVPTDCALQAYTRWMDEHFKSGTGGFPASPAIGAIGATTLGTLGTRKRGVVARGGKRGLSDNDDNSGC